MKPTSSGIKPLCDTCNRNNYPCHCPRASQEIIIACEDFIEAHGLRGPVECSPVRTVKTGNTEFTPADH